MDCSPTDRQWESVTFADSNRAAKYRADVPLSSLSPPPPFCVPSTIALWGEASSLNCSIFLCLLEFLPPESIWRFLSSDFFRICAWHCPLLGPLWCRAQGKKWNATWKWRQKFQGAVGVHGDSYYSSACCCSLRQGRGRAGAKGLEVEEAEIPSFLLPFLSGQSHLQSLLL